MTRLQLTEQIKKKGTYLCVGLDTDPDKLPAHLKGERDGLLRFNREIIEATLDHCVGYKINTAFYEALGSKGWELMERTVACIPDTHLKIADAKRGDIGNTSAQYAKAFFETLPFDAITVAPYMGEDSIRPFLEYTDKWTIVLGLTSNKGAQDFEMKQLHTDGQGFSQRPLYLYEQVIKTVAAWGSTENLMFVIGATQSEAFASIRQLVPDHFFLVPGVGAQGGSLEEISRKTLTPDGGLLVNASRAIIYASSGQDFASAAAAIAKEYAAEMNYYLRSIQNQ